MTESLQIEAPGIASARASGIYITKAYYWPMEWSEIDISARFDAAYFFVSIPPMEAEPKRHEFRPA